MTNKSGTLIRLQKKQNDGFIAVDPSWIKFNRASGSGEPVSDGAGGRSSISSVRQLWPQLCRIVPARSRSSNQFFTLPSGQLVVTKDWTLVGLWNMDIVLNDWFTWGEQDYIISFIYSDRRYQTQAQLDLMGKDYRGTI